MENRTQEIVVASTVSLVGNLLLAVCKILVGILSGSIAVLSDGIDSASDVLISIVMLVAARVINKPPNERFAYGYYKAESAATKLLSFVIFYAGIQMFLSALAQIVHPVEKVLPDDMVIYVTLASVVLKLLLSFHQSRAGKRLNSSMLVANGINMRNDIFTSLGVLVGLGLAFVFDMPILDAVTALVVSLMIIRSSIGVFKDSLLQLMDGVADAGVYQKIFDAVSRVPRVHNPHKVRSRTVGTLHSIVLDIEVDGAMSVREAHQVAHEVECKIREVVPEIYDIVVHVEPLGVSQEHEAYGVDESSLN